MTILDKDTIERLIGYRQEIKPMGCELQLAASRAARGGQKVLAGSLLRAAQQLEAAYLSLNFTILLGSAEED